VGQGHEITVELPVGTMQELGLAGLRERFFAQYEVIYGYAHRHLDLEVMTCRLRATGGVPSVALERVAQDADSVARARKGERSAYVAEAGAYEPVAVYDRYTLRAGASFAGPAIVEERDSTAIIGPHTTVNVDEYLNLVVTLH
jgi:N-methylhydantoinase A